MAEDLYRVLVVDDDTMQLELLERTLRSEGFVVMTCSSPIGVTSIVRSFVPHVVLMDVDIPALSGDRILALARKSAPPMTRFLLHSAADEAVLRRLAKEADADGWISKSTTGAELATRIRALVKAPSGVRR
ncbi:Response regulator [Labilithrix luteola]|uniref:Response regulator n=1 Tax=Labilithrix luteola TaxID=1391654 RepID=A0A0K1PZY3_9BACT|nr:response regulator [Labilithrix luteola]AKU99088.1 Response regulator [Labilithrix luteola]